ncbi:MAG: hypothetical protein ABH807_02835 [Candidatus Shapirobacteria bacterium]
MCDDGKGEGAGRFLAGILVGAVAAVGGVYFLNNTERGRQVKKEIKKKGGELAEEVKEAVEEIGDKGAELKKSALRIEEEIKRKVGSELTHLDELQDRVEGLRDRGRKAVKFFTSSGKKLA